ncbi:MAG: hypothetical protein RIQ33_317 [Bacteroidota bacterium]|jgi:predicted ABC-type ATPase
MRVFAGPNGSGKTTIIKKLQSEIPFGVYVNADDIQKQLEESNVLLFDTYQISVTENNLQAFFKESNFSPHKRNEFDLWQKLKVIENVLHIEAKVDSYLAADIAEFIRQKLLANEISFTFETVMSHASKIDFMQDAQKNGYRVYLYFIATEDPAININRVKLRVSQAGHHVNPAAVKNRYYKSLKLLKPAIKQSNRAYLWDNSGATSLFVAEITKGIDVEIFDTNKVPNWFVKYLID